MTWYALLLKLARPLVHCLSASLAQHAPAVPSQLAVDFSEPVIREMKEKNALVRPGLRFEVMDVTAMGLPSSSVDVVLDKGLLDAMIADGDEAALAGVDKLFAEVVRVLKPGGRYLIISLAQAHVLDKILATFNDGATGCSVEVGVLTRAGEGSKLPPFLFTIVKEPVGDDERLRVREGGAEGGSDTVVHCDDAAAVQKYVHDSQWTHHSHNKLRELRPGNYFTFQLAGAAAAGATGAASARYNVAVVDASTVPRVAALIVPQGRETEFLFGEREGQEQVGRWPVLHRYRMYLRLRNPAQRSGCAARVATVGEATKVWTADIRVLEPGPHVREHGGGEGRAVSGHGEASSRGLRRAVPVLGCGGGRGHAGGCV